MSNPALREKMAARIVDFEARRKNGKIIVYTLPSGDGGGRYEVAGINERYHPVEAAKLRALIESGKPDEAERLATLYIADYTEPAARWTSVPAIEFFLRDSIFNRGPGGAAQIAQMALGVPVDGLFGPVTRGALAGREADAPGFLQDLRAARESYERRKRKETSSFWKGLVNRWDKALAFALTLPLEPDTPTRRTLARSGAGIRRLKMLCVHGVGEHEQDLDWVEQWRSWVETGLRVYDPTVHVEADLLFFQEFFEKAPINQITYAKALASLVGSGLWHGFIPGQRNVRGKLGYSQRVRWTAGMVAQWADHAKLRRSLRDHIHKKMVDYAPDIVAAHSLGSLITYDAFASDYRGDLKGRTYLTFGSQIGNSFVRGTFGGRLVGLEAGHWYHLFNPNDDVLTAPLDIKEGKFTQVNAAFEREGVGDHDAQGYLSTDKEWGNPGVGPIAYSGIADRGITRSIRNATPEAAAVVRGAPRKRALIVRINNYADPAMNLDGCVNDAFLMSALLQECQFQAEDIRLVLNERATAAGIRDRLEWLLDGVKEGDQRVFIYSGHGGKIESYGIGEVVDREDECLVPHDFDWSTERAILDDDLYTLYSQIPYGADVVFFLDCCHAGGLRRDGQAKARGINPPDDIRHRALRWKPETGMWVPRELPELPAGVIDPSTSEKRKAEERLRFTGSSGSTRRLGRANDLRLTNHETFQAAKAEFRHEGPYMPIILQACQETEFAYEYRHGNQSFGAFTFSVAEAVRAAGRKRRKISFQEVCAAAASRIAGLGFAQTPRPDGPTHKLTQAVPWTQKAGVKKKNPRVLK